MPGQASFQKAAGLVIGGGTAHEGLADGVGCSPAKVSPSCRPQRCTLTSENLSGPYTYQGCGAASGDADGFNSVLMRDLLASMPAAVAYVAGPDLVFEFANDDYRQLAGGRDLIGRPYREALPEVAAQPRFGALLRAFRTGQRFRSRESEVWVRRHGGEPEQIFIDTVYQPVRDEAGGIAGVLIFGIDVSEHVRDRRQQEGLAERLASSEERYRTLFETLPHGVVHYDADGSILGANPAASEILGIAPDAMTAWPLDRARRAVHEDGSPYRPDEQPVVVALRTGKIVADVVVGMPHGRTGELRWLRVTAVPDSWDERGRPQRAYAMFTDITGQRRAEAALQESTRLLGRLRDANVLGMVASSEEGVFDANDAFLGMIGYSRRDVAAGRLSYQAITPREWAGHDRAALAQLRATGAFQAYDKEYIHRDGHRVPVMVGGAATGRDPLRWVTFVMDLTAPQRAERERADLRAQAQTAVAEADAAREQLAFLLRAGDLAAASRDRRELLDQVAKLVVPTLADCCVVFLPTAEGTLRAASLIHRDPAQAAVLTDLRDIHIPPTGPLVIQMAFASATTQLVPEVSAKARTGDGAVQEMMEIEKRALLDSALATPLRAGERLRGVVLMGRGAARPRFSKADIPVVEELARRLATGLANVETFAREHTVAETLQHALLPEAPPEIPGLEIAVRYLPATDGVHVGGDWYDVFPLAGDRVGLAIGDVAGHSIASASIMGQVRSLLRAYALDNPSPPDVLQHTNATMSRLLPEAVATVFYAVLDLATGHLTYANAGHPPPLITHASGHARYLDSANGPMLGACADISFDAGHQRLTSAARLLLYTDGLIEDRQRDITDGLNELAIVLERSPAQTAEQTCESVQAALLGSVPREDDVCILAARLMAGPP